MINHSYKYHKPYSYSSYTPTMLIRFLLKFNLEKKENRLPTNSLVVGRNEEHVW